MKVKISWLGNLSAVLALMLMMPGFVLAQRNGKQDKVSPDLQRQMNSTGGDDNPTVNVIVQFTHKANFGQHLKLENDGAKDQKKLNLINAVALTIPIKALPFLQAMGDVVHVSINHPLQRSLDLSAAAVEADVAFSKYGMDGTGVGVAVIDSGIASHRDLSARDAVTSRVVYSESFVPLTSSAVDEYGHGTHVAGIIAGNGTSSATGYRGVFRGMAPNANLINLRVLDQNGSGSESNVIAAIQRAIALKNTYNIRVINLSLGHPVYESYQYDPLCQAVEQAWKAGIVVVVAAGNSGRDHSYDRDGYGTIASPGNDPYVITVGATRTMGTPDRGDDLVASYSSKGPTAVDHIVKPDLVAPGNRVVSLIVPGSTLDRNYPKFEDAPAKIAGAVTAASYFRLSGTSMATPVVSGAAALLVQQNPLLTPDQVKARLMKTAWKGLPSNGTGTDSNTATTYFTEYDIFTIGAGMLDVQAALASTDASTGVAVSPTAVRDPLTGAISLVAGSSVVWGNSVVWGSSVVWGNSVVWGSRVLSSDSVVWGNSVVWGSTAATSYSVVWGNSVVWGASAMSAFSDGSDGEN